MLEPKKESYENLRLTLACSDSVLLCNTFTGFQSPFTATFTLFPWVGARTIRVKNVKTLKQQ